MTYHHKIMAALAMGGSALALAGAAGAESHLTDTSGMSIALSNNYAGNSWRQAMLESWERVAKEAVEKGVIAEGPAFTTAENQATEQAQQLQNLILQGYDAIVIDAASPTALNGTIKQACEQGITVVSFDAVVTEPCAWRIAVDFERMGEMQVYYLAERLEGDINLLEIRGLSGTSVDENIHKGIVRGAEKYDNIEIVGSVHGDWTQTVAQKEVAGILPTLPEIDAVVTQGGDGFGTARAFEAAGRDMPIIIMGNRHDELTWWKEQKEANGYETGLVHLRVLGRAADPCGSRGAQGDDPAVAHGHAGQSGKAPRADRGRQRDQQGVHARRGRRVHPEGQEQLIRRTCARDRDRRPRCWRKRRASSICKA